MNNNNNNDNNMFEMIHILLGLVHPSWYVILFQTI